MATTVEVGYLSAISMAQIPVDVPKSKIRAFLGS